MEGHSVVVSITREQWLLGVLWVAVLRLPAFLAQDTQGFS